MLGIGRNGRDGRVERAKRNGEKGRNVGERRGRREEKRMEQETIRHIWGDLRFYVDGPDTLKEGFVVPGKDEVYRLRHEIVLKPGDQLTFEPYEKHWFQGGPRGAVLYSFSTTVRDGLDGFTDPAIQRVTVVEE